MLHVPHVVNENFKPAVIAPRVDPARRQTLLVQLSDQIMTLLPAKRHVFKDLFFCIGSLGHAACRVKLRKAKWMWWPELTGFGIEIIIKKKNGVKGFVPEFVGSIPLRVGAGFDSVFKHVYRGPELFPQCFLKRSVHHILDLTNWFFAWT